MKAFYYFDSYLPASGPFAINQEPTHTVSLLKEENELKISFLHARDGTVKNAHADRDFNPSINFAQFNSPEPQIILNTIVMLFDRKYIKNIGECHVVEAR